MSALLPASTQEERPCHGAVSARADQDQHKSNTTGPRTVLPALFSIDGCRLAESDPLAPLARDIARSLTEAGLTVHHCAQHDPLYRLGGVCVLTVPPEPRTRHGKIAVSWTVHDLLLLDLNRHSTYTGTQQAMDTAIGEVLRAFGYVIEPLGSTGAWLVTGRRGREVGR